MANESHIGKASIGSTFIVGMLVFALFPLLVIAWFRLAKPEQSYDEKRKFQRLEKLQALHLEDQKKLTAYAWADKQKGVVQIPIDEAMKLVLLELRAKPVQASAIKADPPAVNTPLQQAAAPAASPAAPPAGGPAASPAASPAAAPAASPAASPEVKK